MSRAAAALGCCSRRGPTARAYRRDAVSWDAWLEQLLRSAPIVEHEFDGCVSLGCAVRVAGDSGHVAEYVLVGRRREDSARHELSSGSPAGRALRGVSSCGWSSRMGVTGRYGSPA